MRRLIVCADGTWNKDEARADGGGLTNVVHVRDNIAAADSRGVEQKVLYDRGVGSGAWLDRIFGGAFGSGISRNIRDDCYAFLVQEYEPGDELFLFGFSRGAYTVRSLAGMVRKCGIIRRSEGKQRGDPLDARERKLIAEAYDFYRIRGNETHPSGERATAFRRSRSHEAMIKCLGVWDTVGSLGIPTSGPAGFISRRRHAFHDVKLSSHVLNAFHALAVDERRKPFTPSVWEIPENDPALQSGAWRVEQRWFAGVHSNIGGGYPDRGLSNFALRWIVKSAQECGLEFLPGFVESIDPECRCAGTRYDSMSWFYRAFGEHRRPIGVPRQHTETKVPLLTFEQVDSSVPERCCLREELQDADRARYRPRNFLEHWAKNPDTWLPHVLPDDARVPQ